MKKNIFIVFFIVQFLEGMENSAHFEKKWKTKVEDFHSALIKGKKIAVLYSQRLVTYDIESGKQIKKSKIEWDICRDCRSDVFLPLENENYLIGNSEKTKSKFAIYNHDNDTLIKEFEKFDIVRAAQVSLDNQRLYCGGNIFYDPRSNRDYYGILRIYNLATSQLENSIPLYKNFLEAIALPHSYCITGGSENSNSFITIIDANTLDIVHKHFDRKECIRKILSHNNLLYTCGETAINIYDLRENKIVTQFGNKELNMGLLQENLIVSLNEQDTLKIWDMRTLQSLHEKSIKKPFHGQKLQDVQNNYIITENFGDLSYDSTIVCRTYNA